MAYMVGFKRYRYLWLCTFTVISATISCILAQALAELFSHSANVKSTLVKLCLPAHATL